MRNILDTVFTAVILFLLFFFLTKGIIALIGYSAGSEFMKTFTDPIVTTFAVIGGLIGGVGIVCEDADQKAKK
jgi:membrane associated rhomboid family serine protease